MTGSSFSREPHRFSIGSGQSPALGTGTGVQYKGAAGVELAPIPQSEPGFAFMLFRGAATFFGGADSPGALLSGAPQAKQNLLLSALESNSKILLAPFYNLQLYITSPSVI